MSNIIDFQADKNGAYVTLQNTNAENVTNAMNNYFGQQGYKLEQGAPGNGVYGKGNPTLRIVLGAFHKRFCYNVNVMQNQNGTVQMNLTKADKGRWGGVIGVNQVANETDRHKEALRSFL